MTFKLFGTALVIAALSGCSSQTFQINGKTGQVPTVQESQTFFVGGIGQATTIDPAVICGGVENIIKVESQQTFANGLLAAITLGIYTPRDVKVYCKP